MYWLLSPGPGSNVHVQPHCFDVLGHVSGRGNDAGGDLKRTRLVFRFGGANDTKSAKLVDPEAS